MTTANPAQTIQNGLPIKKVRWEFKTALTSKYIKADNPSGIPVYKSSNIPKPNIE